MVDLSPINIGVISYLVGGLGFVVLTVLFLLGWWRRDHRPVLVLACALNAVWCFVIVAGLLRQVSNAIMILAEIVRDGGWLFFVAYIASDAASRRGRWLLRAGAIVLPAALAGFVFVRMSGLALTGFRNDFLVFVITAMLMSLCTLVLLEQLFRNINAEARWGLKYVCLAIGALFIYEFFMYSYSLLGQHIPVPLWNARGAINALVVPLIVLSAVRNHAWAMDVHVSRRAAFHTGALFMCGGYLLVMSLGGYFVRNLGGSWGEFLAILFCVAALLLLGVLLLSAQVRAHARVLVSKHFFNYKYDYRQEWLGLTQRLSSSGDMPDPYPRAVKAMADVMDSPAGALWLMREGSLACVTHWNMPKATAVGVAADSALACFLRDREWIIDMREYEQARSRYGQLQLPQWLYAVPRARLLIPLLDEHGFMGFVLLENPRSPYQLTWEELDLLKTIGRQVGGFLRQQENNQALAQARQFEAFNRMTAYLMHDLKNIMAQQSLIVKNAQKHKDNPDFIDDMIMTVDSSVARMKALLRQLQTPNAESQSTQRVAVDRVLQGVLDNLRHSRPIPQLHTGGEQAYVNVDGERFATVVEHLIGNAQEATGIHGRVDIAVTVAAGQVHIKIEDDGVGMAPEFVRDHLFQPFYTTKSSRGMGIGAFQAREFVRAAGGQLNVSSQLERGTVLAISLPQATAQAVAVASIQEMRA